MGDERAEQKIGETKVYKLGERLYIDMDDLGDCEGVWYLDSFPEGATVEIIARLVPAQRSKTGGDQ